MKYIFGSTALLLCTLAFGQNECKIPDATLQILSPEKKNEQITQKFKSGEYECAAHIAWIGSENLSLIPGRAGIDLRFDLRELALQLANDRSYPAKDRLALLVASAYSLHQKNVDPSKKSDLQSDVEMLYEGALQFLNHLNLLNEKSGSVEANDIASWLDTLVYAIHLDRRLPDEDRSRRYWGDAFGLAVRQQEFRRLGNVANEMRGDKILDRSSLTQSVYFVASPWGQNATRDVIISRSHDLRRLVDLLNDVHDCYGCIPEWRWYPIMRIGSAYFRVGLKDEAKINIDEALQIVRGIESPDYRLGQYRSVISELLNVKYDRPTVLSVLKDMELLANSLDTPIAKETRQYLPQYAKRLEENASK